MTIRLGLIGFPLKHSFSPRYFSQKFSAEKIENCVYESFPIKSINDLPELIKSRTDLVGLNVTIPYKESVLQYIDTLSLTAAKVSAVNTIKIIRHKDKTELCGYNTDVIGFEESLKPLLKSCDRSALVIGTGGASKAVCFVLNRLNIDFKLISRSEKKGVLTYKNITKADVKNSQLIINTTPLGMYPDIKSRPGIPYEAINKSHLLYDLVYHPEMTAFLKAGLEQHARIKNGYEMLQRQAEASWELWQISY